MRTFACQIGLLSLLICSKWTDGGAATTKPKVSVVNQKTSSSANQDSYSNDNHNLIVDSYNILQLGVLDVIKQTNDEDSRQKKRRTCRCPDDDDEDLDRDGTHDGNNPDKRNTQGEKERLLELAEQEALFASLGRVWASSNLPDSVLQTVEDRFA